MQPRLWSLGTLCSTYCLVIILVSHFEVSFLVEAETQHHSANKIKNLGLLTFLLVIIFSLDDDKSYC